MINQLLELLYDILDTIYHESIRQYSNMKHLKMRAKELAQFLSYEFNYFWEVYLEQSRPYLKNFVIWSYELFIYSWQFYAIPLSLTFVAMTWIRYPLPPEVFGPLLLTLLVVSFLIPFIVWMGETYSFLSVLHDKFMLVPLCMALYFPCCFGGWLWFESPEVGFSNWREYHPWMPIFLKTYQPFAFPSFTFGYIMMIFCFWLMTHMTFYQYIRYMASFQDDAFMMSTIEEDDKYFAIWEKYEEELAVHTVKLQAFYESLYDFETYIDFWNWLIKKKNEYFKKNV